MTRDNENKVKKKQAKQPQSISQIKGTRDMKLKSVVCVCQICLFALYGHNMHSMHSTMVQEGIRLSKYINEPLVDFIYYQLKCNNFKIKFDCISGELYISYLFQTKKVHVGSLFDPKIGPFWVSFLTQRVLVKFCNTATFKGGPLTFIQ